MRPKPTTPRRWARSSAIFRSLGLLWLLCAMPSSAWAALSCTAQTQALSFGTYNPKAAAANESTGSVEVKCTCTGFDCLAFTYSIEIDAGVSGSVSDRRMRRPGESSGGLQYRLYRDGLRLTAWDTGANKQSVLYLLNLFGSWQSTTVYGRIPAGQAVASGGYTDAPGVLISY